MQQDSCYALLLSWGGLSPPSTLTRGPLARLPDGRASPAHDPVGLVFLPLPTK